MLHTGIYSGVVGCEKAVHSSATLLQQRLLKYWYCRDAWHACTAVNTRIRSTLLHDFALCLQSIPCR
jgi:hypothetical protein